MLVAVAAHSLAHRRARPVGLPRVAQQLEAGEASKLARVRRQPVRRAQQLGVAHQSEPAERPAPEVARLPAEQVHQAVELGVEVGVALDGESRAWYLPYRGVHIGERLQRVE